MSSKKPSNAQIALSKSNRGLRGIISSLTAVNGKLRRAPRACIEVVINDLKDALSLQRQTYDVAAIQCLERALPLLALNSGRLHDLRGEAHDVVLNARRTIETVIKVWRALEQSDFGGSFNIQSLDDRRLARSRQEVRTKNLAVKRLRRQVAAAQKELEDAESRLNWEETVLEFIKTA